MKKGLLILIMLLLSIDGFAQVVAYPSTNTSLVFGAGCIDLHYVNHTVIGYQINVSISYYANLTDAQNTTNVLDRFYEPLSNPQTIFARVDSDLDATFAIAECILEWTEYGGGGPPPTGISPCEFMVCDVDNNGSEIIYLNNIRCFYHGYGFPTTTFCASLDSEIETTFYLTENDAINETNVINPVYTLTGYQIFYRKIKNTTTNESQIEDLIRVDLVTCTTDTDADGIPDLVEDVNRNLLNTDDDTDQDGLKNYEDDDDDGDGILTVDEDYNNNGDPTDDDTDNNGIADYLEANVALTYNEHDFNTFKIYPNPARSIVNIEFNQAVNIVQVNVYSIFGNILLQLNRNLKRQKLEIDVSKLSTGIYFINLIANGSNQTQKLIIK